MTWIKQSDELYINDQTFFSLEKIDGIWYVINNKDNFKSIPFTDIFNNPVFPIDLSNVDLIVKSLVSTGAISGNSLAITNAATAKHFRGEAANTPATPALSFQTDLDTGLYRISDGIIGVSSNGALVAFFDSNGITANVPYWNIVDSKPSGTGSGVFSSGAWRTRDLNTTIGNNTISGSSLASNQFILPAGTYRISASAPSYACNTHKAKLRNITDSTDTILGTSETSNQTYNGATRSFIFGIFTITSQKTFEIQHQCQSTQNFGSSTSFGVNEIYTVVELWKLA